MSLNTDSLSSLDDVAAFLDGSPAIEFSTPEPAQRGPWMVRSLRLLGYQRLDRGGRGLVLRYLRAR